MAEFDHDDILEYRDREGQDMDVRKRKRGLEEEEQGVEGVRPARRLTAEEEDARILAAVAQDDRKGEDFDLASLRKLVLNFERKG